MAGENALDSDYLDATIGAESSGNPNATSYDKYGNPIARGLTQLTDRTGLSEFEKLKQTGEISQDTEYDPYDPDLNKKIGGTFLAEQEAEFKDKRLASAAYNAGPSRVKSLLKEYGDTYEDIAAYLPIETQKYVARVASNYNKLKASKTDEAPTENPNASLIDTIKTAPATAQGFAKSTLTVTQDPDFATLPFSDQAQKVTEIYNSKNWGKEGYSLYKDTMSKLWDAADPNEIPDISEIVGAPPVVPPDQKPKDVLTKWRDTSVQKLIQRGLTPGYFGNRLDQYFENATKAETEAYDLRNEGMFSAGASATGNFVRSAVKGAISNVTDAAAYATRLASTPENAFKLAPDQLNEETKTAVEVAKERADYIQKLPELLGNPSNVGNYATDKNGRLKLNPDGTPQLKTQEEAMLSSDNVGRAIGQIGSLLAGGWALKAYGASTAATSAITGSTMALQLANSSYQTVYNDTNGDSRKALTASLMAAPIGFVGELGNLKVISKEISPIIKEMTAADKALYVANSLAKSTAIGAGVGVGMDIAQQGAEILQTGRPFNPQRTERAAITGGVASALVGSIHDYVAGSVSSFAQGKMRSIGDKALNDFRQSTDTSRVIEVPAVSKDIIESFGMDVVSNNNGSVTVTKKGVVVPEGQPLSSLTESLRNTYTSDEIKELGAKQSELSIKEKRTPEEDSALTSLNKVLQNVTRPEYQNEVKAIEKAIENHISEDKGALLVRRDPATNHWEHIEDGTTSLNLKDLLFKKEPEYTKDLSDISSLKVYDEDLIKNEVTDLEPINPKATEEHINLTNQLDRVNNEIRDLQNERDSLPKLKLTPSEAINPKATEEHVNLTNKLGKVNNDIRDLQNERDLLPKVVKGEEDVHAERRAEIAKDLKNKTIEKRKLQSEVERTRGPRDTEQAALEAQKKAEREDPYREKREKLNEQLNQKNIEKRKLQSDISRTKGPRDTEQAALEAQKKTQKELEKRKADKQKKIDAIKKAGEVGRYDSKDHSITLTSHDTPEAKAETTAHEIAHGVAKDLELSSEANRAIDDHIKTLEASIPVSTVQALAGKVFLPNSRKRALRNVPENAPANKLNPKAKKAIIDRGEIIANQIGAIMLKRAGIDIGDFKILPEIEASLRKTKLPDVNEVLNPKKVETIKETVNAQEKQTTTAAPSVQAQKNTQVNVARESSNTGGSTQNISVPPDNVPRFNTETGKVEQTRFSKKVTEQNPNVPKTEYNKVSETEEAISQAKAHIEKNGLEKTIKDLSSPESLNVDPRTRSILTNEVFRQAQAEANANPTPKTLETANLARQVRERAGTISAQSLGLLSRFREAGTFEDLIANINRAYIDAGIKPPDYTQAMIDELRGQFEKADKLPKGSRARDAEVDSIFQKTLGFNKTNWASFLSKYARTNLLSGLGTQLVVANSSLYMGPVLTALSHPFQGAGLVWRAMWQASGLARSNARAVLAGEGGKALFNGIFDPSPVAMGLKPSVESGFAKLYSKFGDKFLNALAATHTYAKTLSAEGFLAHRGFLELKEKYGNDPAKFSAEVSKLILNPKDIEAAKAQAKAEYENSGITPKPGVIGARAYEILRTQSHSPEQLSIAEDYARGVSHAGEMGNVTHQMALSFFNQPLFTQNPLMAPVRFIVQPFGRAMLALSDYAIDYIPGNRLIDPAIRRLGNALDSARGGKGDFFKPRSEALQTRLRNAQAVGAVMSATLLGLSRSGLFRITGDVEKSDLEGEGKDFETTKATNRADFAEAKQKGDPEYSIIFPNGFSIEYKDLPGLNALAYGIWHVNKAIDSGKSIPETATKFYTGAFSYAMPFLGGGTLNSPIYTLYRELLNPETNSNKAQDALQASAERWNKIKTQSVDTAEKFLVPFSSLLRDIQQVYDEPEESHQELMQKAFRNVPGVATLIGSQNSVDRFGDPIKRTGLEHVPGVHRLIGEVSPLSGDVWDKLNAKGLTVKEMGNYINFTQSDLGSKQQAEAYKKTREERIGSAYARTLTPDEWLDFRKTTGPYIKVVANSIADSSLPHDQAQELLTKRINAIEEQALKRYVATGKF